MSISKDTQTRVTTQIKTVTSLFMELVKTNTPSFNISLSNFAKKLPFQNFPASKNSESQAGSVNQRLDSKSKTETKSGIPSYFDLLKVKTENTNEEAIPRWKVKRKTISQESIDARTKHVVSAVAKATTQSSLLMRLEELCNHLFQYPQAKSLASRVTYKFKKLFLS